MKRIMGPDTISTNNSVNQIKKRYRDATTNLDGIAVTYCPMDDRSMVLEFESLNAEIMDQAVYVATRPTTVTQEARASTVPM